MRSEYEIVDYANELRKQEKLSMDDFAQLTNTAKSSISRYFAHKQKLPYEKIELWAKALRTTPEDLLGIDTSSKNESIDEALSHVMSYNGKPLSDHDRKAIANYAKFYLQDDDSKDGD